MDWSPQQDEALRKGKRWVAEALSGRTRQRVWRLHGFAGTGKSTLAKELVGGIDGVLYCAPTGKAAQVMRSKGCVGAMTIHRALYKVVEKGTAKLEELLAKLRVAEIAHASDDQNAPSKEEVEAIKSQVEAEEAHLRELSFCPNPEAPAHSARLIVVDEASMVGRGIGRDLEALGIPLLVQGDPGQLPPINDVAHFMDPGPDVLLTEIHRQARDSGILRLATALRNDQGYKVGSYGTDCRVVRQGQAGNQGLVVAADQMLVGLNKTRRDANYTLRMLKGREDPMPMHGDKLVCLQNNNDLDLVNGMQYLVDEPGLRRGTTIVDVGVVPLDPDLPSLTVDMHACIFGGVEVKARERRMAEHFDHAEAMTVHKAQGSQWSRVYGIDESAKFDSRWLYTMVTRAESDLTLVAAW